MTLFEKIPITFEDKDYEIRVLYDDSVINVVAFLNNYPANGIRHQVKLPKDCDIEAILEKGAVKDLVKMCTHDITEKRWERISEIIRASMTKNAG